MRLHRSGKIFIVAAILGGAVGAFFFLRNSKSESISGVGPGVFSPQTIGAPIAGLPWITNLCIHDLDRDGLLDVLVAEGRLNQVSWIRQVAPGQFEETPIGESVAGPAQVAVADIDGDGDLDVLVASMGSIPPSNDKIGAVIVLENDGTQRFRNRVLLDRTSRVSCVAAADLDGDGDLDLAVGQFGYFEGEIRWMENLGNMEFRSHALLDLSGTVAVRPVDLEGDGDLDLVALVSQDWEEVYAFENQGGGRFEPRVLHGSTNKDYGSSGLDVGDLDGDGDPDIVYTNGDGFDYATPGARPWHGVQWLENVGQGKFSFHRIGDFSGAYSPRIVDLDGDGDQDIVASGAFNDWRRSDAVSLMAFENDGNRNFTPRILAYRPTHLVVVDAADLDGDGRVELVTGGLHFHPPNEHLGRVTWWKQDR